MRLIRLMLDLHMIPPKLEKVNRVSSSLGMFVKIQNNAEIYNEHCNGY